MEFCGPLPWDSIISPNVGTWVVYSILVFLSLFGAMGNAIVFCIYRRDRIRHPYHLFSVVLAVHDFVMCVICTPACPILFLSSSSYLIAIYSALVAYIFCQNMNLYFLIAVYRLAVLKRADTNAMSLSTAKGLCVGSFVTTLSMAPAWVLGRLGYLKLYFGMCLWAVVQYFIVLLCMSSFNVFIYCRLYLWRRRKVAPNQIKSVSAKLAAEVPGPSPRVPSNASAMCHADTRARPDIQDRVGVSRVVTVDHAGRVGEGTLTLQLHAPDQLQRNRQKKIARAGLTLLVCTVVFMLCWAPSVFGDNLGLFNASRIRTVIFIQCSANPVIYFFTQSKFKREVKLRLRNLFRCFSQCNQNM